MNFRAAIVGCGMIAGRFEDFNTSPTYSHAKAFLQNSAFGDIGFYDRHQERAENLALKAKGKAFDSIEKLLNSFRPDVVSICVTDKEHYGVMNLIMRSKYAPRLIFAEKPVCTRREELTNLIRLEVESKSSIIVNHSRRFDLGHQRIKNLLACRELGEPVYLHINYYGGWHHMGVHIVDTLQFFFDDELQIDSVEYCCESKYVHDPTLNIQGNIASASVRLDGFPENYYQILDMNLMCQAGQIKLSDFGNRIDVLRKIVNTEHENVLVFDPERSGKGMESPISEAVKVIVAYLESTNEKLIEPFGLAAAEKTMKVLWKGSDAYQS